MSVVLTLAVTSELEALISALPGVHVVALGLEAVDNHRFDMVKDVGRHNLPDVIVLGEDLKQTRVVDLARIVDAELPQVALVVEGSPESEFVLQAMRYGVRDFVDSSISAEDLHAVMVRAVGHSARQTSIRKAPTPAAEAVIDARVITILSPKGGVGKTSISTSTAIGLAEIAPMGVVLVDLDLQFGDVASVLNLTPENTLADAFENNAQNDSLLLRSLLTVHSAGFYVLCGADSPAANEAVTGDQVRTLIAQLASQFRYVVVDTAAGLSAATMAALEESTDAVVVSSMDVACIRGVRKEVDVLSELGVLPAVRHVVLNFADRQSGMKVRDVEGVIGLPVNVIIPMSPDVRLASNHGEPLMLKKRSGPYVKAIRVLVERFEQEIPTSKNIHRGVKIE